MLIESLQNPRIKNLLKLQEKSRERKNQGLFIVEGTQENELAVKGCYEAVEIYICEDIYNKSIDFGQVKVFTITKQVFEKIDRWNYWCL
jgi:TrmH family RNA methyltransferase